jgi:TolB-like protein/Tfp pilus assembly protein PilF
MAFWGELRRRNVIKVGVAYVVVAWLLIQIVATVMPMFSAPPWIAPTITFLLIIGFPMVLIVAWAFEITPEGIKKTRHVPREESITHVTGQKLNYVLTGLLAIAVGYIVIDNLSEDSGRQVPEESAAAATVSPAEATVENVTPADRESAQPLSNSVAVIPFTNLSPREEDAYFAAGIHEEILNQLVKLSRLSVIARTSVLQYAGTQKTIPEIARELNVESVMEGSVRYADGRVLVTAQLVDAATNLHLWSESYEREFANNFAIQSDIAMNVANALEAEFSPAEQESIEKPPTDSVEAYELYLVARDQYRAGRTVREALESVDAALALDPEFAPAWILKSQIHALISQAAAVDVAAAHRQTSVAAAQRAVEIDASLVDAQAQLAAVYTGRAEWAQAERIFRSANATTTGASAYALHLYSVGRLAQAHEMETNARRLDPFNQTTRAFYLLGLALSGDMAAADREYDRATTLFGEPWFGSWFIVLARLGNGPVSIERIPPYGEFQSAAREHLDSPESGIAILRERYDSGENISTFALLQISVWSAYFGDPDFALDVLEDTIRLNAQNTLHLWLPAMREVRRLPRFRELVREIGLVDYWQEFGWSDLCRPVGASDFECS